MSWELLLIAVGLAMDAFAVAIGKGLSVERVRPKHMLLTGAYFGGFQALMPLIGYILGAQFEGFIASIDHWIAFILLGVIGVNMIREAHKNEAVDSSFGVKTMLLLAVATSIDALAVGISFALLQVKILPAAALIGGITFLLCVAGVKIGSVFGMKYKAKAEIFGGVILILMGLKILLEHLGILVL